MSRGAAVPAGAAAWEPPAPGDAAPPPLRDVVELPHPASVQASRAAASAVPASPMSGFLLCDMARLYLHPDEVTMNPPPGWIGADPRPVTCPRPGRGPRRPQAGGPRGMGNRG